MSPPDQPRRGLTAAAFASLLDRLGPDPDRAGEAYEALRRVLVGFFTWRGATTPDACADETLDRLAARLGEGVAVQDVPRFARGIARLVLLEHWRRPDAQQVAFDERAPHDRVEVERPPDVALHACLEKCLGELSADARKLILDYYVAEGRDRIDSRKRLAQAMGVSETALRNRAQRLRDRLEQCITECLAAETAPRPAHSDTNG
jgi:DNA-directed RNA polymerase specialized sigma24 family protein